MSVSLTRIKRLSCSPYSIQISSISSKHTHSPTQSFSTYLKVYSDPQSQPFRPIQLNTTTILTTMPPLDSAEYYFGKPGEIIVCNLSGSRTIPQTGSQSPYDTQRQHQNQHQHQQGYSQRAPSQYSVSSSFPLTAFYTHPLINSPLPEPRVQDTWSRSG